MKQQTPVLEENPVWWKNVQAELKKRDADCTLKFGHMNVYEVPRALEGNPYRFIRTRGEFRKKYPFNVAKDCKFINRNIANKTDVENRYYKLAKYPAQCAQLNGYWDGKAVSRENKYDRGVCWVHPQQQKCSALAPPEVLRPYDMRNNPSVRERIPDVKSACEKEKGCVFLQKGKYSYDCQPKGQGTPSPNTASKRIATRDAPRAMPKNKSDGLETYLEELYIQKKHGTPPATTELLGKGNRCQAQDELLQDEGAAGPKTKVVVNPWVPTGNRPLTADVYTDLTRLDPHRQENVIILQKYGVPQEIIRKIRHRWFMVNHQKRDPKEYADEDPKVLLAPYMTKLSDLDDEPINSPVKAKTPSPQAPVSTLKPSVPQSIVNNVMKMIAAQSDSDNRGLLAWHSLGSGKTCTAAGVIDAFWDTDRQIIFASSIDALASNPEYKFHECARNLYPRFMQPQYTGKTEQESLSKIAQAFQERGVRFLSFAKLANRVKKTEDAKGLSKRQRRVQSGGEYRRTRSKSSEEKKKRSTKTTAAAPKRKASTKAVVAKKTQGHKKTAPSKTTQKAVKEAKVTKTSAAARATKIAKTTKAKPTKDVKPSRGAVKQRKTAKKAPQRRVSVKASPKPLKQAKQPRQAKNISQHLTNDEYVDLDNAILIIDEVHNLFRPLATQKTQHQYLESQLIDPKRHPGLKVVILTATPGDNIVDVVKLLNIIRDVSAPQITLPNVDDPEDILKFKQKIRGLVSYFDMSKDSTKFPKVHDDEAPIKIPMSEAQLDKYIQAYKEVKPDHMNFQKLAQQNQVNKYWQAARKYANTLYNMDKGMDLSDFSAKLPVLLEKVQNTPMEKHYIYSSFYENRGYGGHGVLAIAKELEKQGYTKLTVVEAKRFNKTGTLPKPGVKRYILATTKEIGEEGSASAGENLHELVRIFNHSDNAMGQIIHVLLASQGFNEGVDLKGVRHVHFFEPLIRLASDIQTIGRAARYCSHADLDKNKGEWVVQVHRYMSDMPVNEVKQKDGESLEDKLKRVNHQLLSMEQQIEKLVEERDSGELDKEGLKVVKESIREKKARLAELKRESKELQKEVKQIQKANAKQVENIEERIFKESRSRVKELMVVYQAMKEAAIDCRVLSNFHSETGSKILCENF